MRKPVIASRGAGDIGKSLAYGHYVCQVSGAEKMASLRFLSNGAYAYPCLRMSIMAFEDETRF